MFTQTSGGWRTHCQTIYRTLVWSPHCGITHRKESGIITSWNCFAGLTVNHSPPPLPPCLTEGGAASCLPIILGNALSRTKPTIMEVSLFASESGNLLSAYQNRSNLPTSQRSLNIVVHSSMTLKEYITPSCNILRISKSCRIRSELVVAFPRSLVVVSSQYVSLIVLFNADTLAHCFRFLWDWFSMSQCPGSLAMW